MAQDTIDISANQTHPIDFVKVKASGIKAVFIKATEGTSYTNPYLHGDATHQNDLRDAIAAGLQVACYHFAKFGDPNAEANYFHNAAGMFAKVLDIETSTNAAWADQFLVALNQPSAEEMTYGSASSLPHNITRGLLWPAAYGPNPPGFGQLWQDSQTGQVPGVMGNVDTSRWTGTDAQWNAFFGITPTPGGQPLPPYLLAVHPTNPGGYWIIRTSDGAIEAYGPVGYFGAGNNLFNNLNNLQKMVGQVADFQPTPSGNGYYILNTNGQIYAFGDARPSGNWK